MYANARIVDAKSGRVLDKKSKLKIGAIPKLTNRFTAIIDGNEYQTTNQIRRKSGIYARIKNNGDLENEFNLSKGFNFDFTIYKNNKKI